MIHIYPSRVAAFLFASPIRKIISIVLLTAILPLIASATHFRYGNITWTNTTGNTVVFKIQQSWRYSYPWAVTPTVGTYINITATGSAQFSFGDGTVAAIILQVTSVNIPENWFYGEATIVKTYATPGWRTASWQSQARISSLQNNPDGSYRVETKVNVGAGNSSPVMNITPMVNLATGNPAATFTVPAIDPDGGPLTFSLATSLQAAGAGFTYVHPAGLSLNPQTGVVTFSTVGKLPGQLYTTQIIVTDQSGASVAIDFVIKIVPVGNAPVFDYEITPANGRVLTVVAGTPLSFDIKALDSDPQQVILSAAGVPVGASFNPALAAVGNPVTSKFSWTPSINQTGNYIISFQAVDPIGLSSLTSVTIKVILCDISLSLQPTQIKCFDGNDGAIDLTVTGGRAPLSFTWSNGESSEDINGLKAGAYTVSVLDQNGCLNEISTELMQPVAPLDYTTSVTPITCHGGTGAISITPIGGTAPYSFTVGNEKNNSGSFTGLSAGNYLYSVTDANGCTISGDQDMQAPAPIVSDIQVSPVTTGIPANTIYLGYGPQLLRLTGNATGGTGHFDYNWGNDGSGTTISVSPATTTKYTLFVKDANKCEASMPVTINVVDLSCGNKNDKVSICHKAGDHYVNICISPSAVAAHLAHGDQLGNCTENTFGAKKSNDFTSTNGKSFAAIYPNPASTFINVQWSNNYKESVSIKVLDVQGRIRLLRNFSGLKENIIVKRLEFDGLSKGIYVLQIISGKDIRMMKFTVK